MHIYQREILLKLLFSKGLTFTQLKPEKIEENSQYDFHLKTLIKEGLIEKKEDFYILTNKGKEFANRMEAETKDVVKQAKVGVWICPVRIINNENQYLIYTRRKNPFYGAQGFMAGKLRYGEELHDCAQREMFEETGLSGKFELIHIRHYINKLKDTEEVIEDKFFYLLKATEIKGELEMKEEGYFEWIPKSKLAEKVTNHFESFESFLKDIDIIDNYNGQFTFSERVEHPDKF